LLFDENFTEPDILQAGADASSSAEIPTLTLPKEIQAPNKIPTLYPFVRTSVYLLMDADKAEHNPKTLKLSATSKYGPLQLTIPIQSIGSGEIIHQLACRKAVIELEEEHGWLSEAKDDSGNSFQQFHLETKQRIVQRECQRLGIKFQVTGKHCSFVALEEDLGKQDKTDSPGNSSNQSSPGRTSGITVTSTGLKEHSVQHLLPSSFTSFSGGARFMDTRPDTKYVHPHRQVDYALSNTFGRNSSHACRTNPFATQSQFGVAQSHGAERKEIIIGGGSLFGVAANAPPPQSQFGVTQSRGGEKKRRKGDSFFGVAVNRLPLQSQFGEAQIREGQKGGGGLFGAPRGSPFSTQSPFGVARSGGRDVGGSSLFGASDKASSPQDSFEERPTLSSLRPQAQFQMACFAPGRADPAGGVKGPRGQAMPPAKPPADTIHELIELQNFDGSWTWSKKLFTVLGLHEEETTRTIVRMCDQHMNTDAAKFPNGDEKTVIATLLAIGYLENKYLKSRSVWELLHAKADAWVTQKLHQMGDPFLGDTCSHIRSMA
jgi:hypothetical protein